MGPLMTLMNPAAREHELESPRWVRSRDFERFPAGGGFEVPCSCGWRGPLRTTTGLAWIAATAHLADVLGPDVAVPPLPPVAPRAGFATN